ncbi:insecticidal delta-endotoxin Cry8Ea1 family protein [Bacillus thuringiensis]|uniref:insecticidal delta-endotoxin Cry8Ea1 family protein n=1 Tax=Bacillus thuringiensis TaxID=1428 RepID=UPI00119EA316|nr:insecticidal delta-endotoxin Cry8Ea1 family protein [Bacillus thuringiensis]
MKYKDRKHAKHKYKQALLATVATMTFGVSTLGSTDSAFAEEKDKNATQQQNTVQQKDAGTYYEGEQKELNPLAQLDKWTQDLGKTSGAGDYKTTLGMVEKLLPTIYKDLNSGNFNNTARSFTMLSTALIPYGGAFISPIVGLIWPENTTAQDAKLQKMVEGLTSMMGQKIDDYDLAKLKQKTDALTDTLKKFQDSVNNKPQSESYYDNIQTANVTYADYINTKFEEIIKESQTPGHQIPELPIFTVIATAHLQFLHFIEENAVKNPRIKMDPEHLNRYFPKFKDTAEKYKKYINNVNHDAQQWLYDFTGGGHIKANNPAHIEAMNKIADLTKQTSDNEAFLLASNPPSAGDKTGLVKDGDKWHYYSPRDGFENSQHQKFNKGSLVTGPLDIDGRTYLFSFEEGMKNSAGKKFNKGDMFTGWYNDAGVWSYYKPESGVMATGWQNISGKWYYFATAYQEFNGGAFISKGDMIKGKTVEISGKLYTFDENGACLNPDGKPIAK